MPSHRIIQPTARDEQVLLMISLYRFVLTSQIKTKVFAGTKDLQVTRRRLRRLHDAGLIDYIDFSTNGKGSSERVHFITSSGSLYIQEKFPGTRTILYSKRRNFNYPFMRHAIACSEFRLNLELALQNHPRVAIKQYVSEFELTENPHDQGMHRLRIYWSFTLPNRPKHVVMYPDSLIVLAGRDQFKDQKILLFLEVDRGTERLAIIHEKITGYNLFRERGFHKQFGVNGFKILFQCHSSRRMENIRESLFGFKGSEMVRLTSVDQVNAESIAADPIWRDVENRTMSLLKG